MLDETLLQLDELSTEVLAVIYERSKSVEHADFLRDLAFDLHESMRTAVQQRVEDWSDDHADDTFEVVCGSCGSISDIHEPHDCEVDDDPGGRGYGEPWPEHIAVHGNEPSMSDVDDDDCPTHGRQLVRRSYASRGSDPYNVNVLACGDHVSCFGPHEPNVIVRSA